MKIMRALAYLFAIPCSGLATLKLWNWFLVPALHTDAINFVTAMGLGLLFGKFALQMPNFDEEESEHSKNSKAIFVFFLPFYLLFVGWFIHLFQ